MLSQRSDFQNSTSRSDRIILVVDDDDANRYVVSHLLSQAGYGVREAATGTDALELATEQPDLIILDIKLPDINGFEVCRQLKADPLTRLIPVLHLSAQQTTSFDKIQGLDNGADGYLVHPVNPLELIANVKALLRIRQVERQLQQSEQKFRAIFDQTFQFIGLLEVDGTVIECNQSSLDFAGVDLEDVVGRPFWETYWWKVESRKSKVESIDEVGSKGERPKSRIDLGVQGLRPPSEDEETRENQSKIQNLKSKIPSPKQEQLREAIQRAAQGEFVRYEVEVRGIGDEIATIDFSLKPVRDEQGNVVLLIPEGRDISEQQAALRERQQLEAQLQQREREMCTMVHNLPDLIFRLDRDLRHIYVCPRIQQVSGIAAEEFIGKTGRELGLPVEACDRFEEKCREALATGQMTQVEYKIGDRYYSSRLIPEYGTEGEIESLLGITEDISERQAALRERKRSEIELHQANERFVLAADAVNGLIYDWDLTTNRVERTRAITEIFGYTLEEAEPTTQWWQALIHPEDLQNFSPSEVWETFAREGRYCSEYRVLHKDGHYVWVEDRGIAVKDDSGSIVRVVGSTTDISDRKRAEEALRESEEWFRAIVNQVAVGIAQTDLTGQFVLVNQQYCDLVGYSEVELLQMRMQDITHPDDLQLNIERFEQLVTEGREFSLEKRYCRKDGSEVWVNNSVSGVRDVSGTIQSAVAVVVNISDRKRAEIALHDAQESLTIAIEAAQMGTWSLDLTKDVSERRSFRHDQIFGYDTPQIKWGQEICRRHVVEEDREIFDAAFTRAMEMGELDFEVRIQWSDGSIHWMAARGRFYFDENGNPLSGGGVNYDISDRKLAEEALKESEERFRSTFDSAAVGIAHIGTNGQWLLVNQTLCDLVGYTREELLGMTFQDITYPEDLETDLAYFYQMLANEIETYSIEKRYIRKDGALVWSNLTVSLLREPNGEPKYFISVIQNIDDRKRLEESLQRSSAEIYELYNNAPCGYHSLDSEGNFVLVNETALKMLGYSQNELIGKKFSDLLAPESVQKFEENFPQFKQRGWVLDLEFQLIRKNGTILTASVSATAIKDEQGNYLQSRSTFVDISERKQAEQALRDSERRYETLVKLAPVGIYRCDRTGNVTYVNARGCEITGLSQEESFGLDGANALHPDDRERVMQQWLQAVENQQPFHSEHRLLLADGRIRWAIVQALPETDENEQVIGYIATLTDITDRKRAEIALQDSERRVATLARLSPVGLFRCDRQASCFYANERCSELLGLPHEEILGWGWTGALHPEDLNRVVRESNQAISQNLPFYSECRFLHPDGKMVWVIAQALPEIDSNGRVVGYIGTITDISERQAALRERKRAEEALQASEARFRQIFECNMVPMGIWAREGGLSDANDALLNLIGYSRQELQAGNIDWIELTPPEYHDLDRNALAETDERGVCTPFEKEYIHKDGRRIPIIIGGASFSDSLDSGVFFAIDLTARQQAEQALRESEARLKQLVDLNLLGVMFWDVDGSILDANDAFLDLIGYSREDLQAGRLNWRHLTPPEQIESSDRSLDTMRDRNSSTLEKEYIRSNGKRIPVLLGGVMFKGSRNRGVSFVVDLSDRKKMEDALRESEQRYASLAKLSPVGIFRGDRDGINCFYANERACEIAGLGSEEVLGTHWLDALHPDDRERVTQLWRRVVAENLPFYAEYRFLHDDGTIRWVIGQAIPETDLNGQVLGYIGTVTDISDRKQVEIELRENEARFRQIAETIEDVFWVSMPWKQQILYLSPAYERIWGRTCESAYENYQTWFESLHPEDRERTFTSFASQIEEGSFDAEYRIIRPDGTIRWIHDRGYAIRDESGNLQQIVGIAEDISDRKIAEIERQKLISLVENSSDFIGIASLEGQILFINEAGFKLVGLEGIESLEQVRLPNFFFPEDWDDVAQQQIPTALRDGQWLGEFRFKHFKTGEAIAVECNVFPIRDPDTNQPIAIATVTRDIRERKQTQRALQENEQRLQLALNGANQGTWDWNIKTEVLSWDNRCKEIFGLPPDFPVTYEWHLDALHPDDRARVSEAATVALRDRSEFNEEYRTFHPDGTMRWVLARGRGYYDANGEAYRMSGTVFDISEQQAALRDRKEAEEALRQSEEQRRLALDLTHLGSFDWNLSNNEVMWNDNHFYLLGLEPGTAESSYATWRDRVHPEDIDRTEQAVAQAITTQTDYQAEYRIVRPDGTIRWLLGKGRGLYDEAGNPQRMLGIVLDISDLKQAEAALQTSEARLMSFFEANIIGILYGDIYGRIKEANDEFLRIIGYTRDDLNAGRLRWDEITPEEYFPLDSERVAEARARGACTPYEKEYIRSDGTRVPILIGYSLVGETREESVAFILDLSEQKQAEQDREQLLTLLTKRNQELDRFTYVVSHDLKAPLRAIANLSQWIEEDLKGQLPEDSQRQMELLRSRVFRMEALISGLLAYSKIGRTVVASETIDVSELLEEILDSLDPPATFIIDVQATMPTLTTKKLLLSQVFSNLISNAIKHSDRADGRIEIRAITKGKYYEFSVSDNGGGIAPENHEKVFGIFQTVKGRDQKENTGIGLSIVKKIVESEGGAITLESELGQGATFRFTWPFFQ
ncbi:MAG: PAS domain S-box protein [Hydrococcus sp. Prado102]|nr:PAS domain S-box protein [Hydrococcus sp. Prado102]